MEEKFDQIKYQNDFNKQKYDRVSVMFPKGEKEVIKAAAEQAGKSVNAYILEAVRKQMERGE